ncbi:MAG: aspartate--tRNA ligase [Erysipelotrichaceae bacterium]|nr:aspartate--tRNA ligase [Erysipelotrichaceae bacterium]MCI6700121.1 aspartate--tRNA ligase [Solobacterium sp.]MCI7731932.1 aspartate--tRNA ligase [Solobacterium sp.]MDD5983651.1 aspartate--tRNA ligase [Solobacterium sp.]MDY2732669.1 aspartate--tRNA ligase [Erysipelotrichaceae bacterium]
MYRDHTCGQLRKTDVGKEVLLSGWVARRRNLGSIVFIDLRDRYGITQLTFDEAHSELVKDVRNEYVLQVKGKVQLKEVANPKLSTGEIEVLADECRVLSKSKTTPMIIADETDALEETRLKYRYLDIRRNPIKEKLILRDKVTTIVRSILHEDDFVEVETPILSKSTPEGARDYLVPSRLYNGRFYALPQSPQIYKQLLMIGGMDRYFQIARCFRDEDLRADRQPEFTQIDIEMSFAEEEDIFGEVEKIMRAIFKQIKGVDNLEFPRIKYDDAMALYGSDKPDLRFGNPMSDISELFANTEFKVFKDVLSNNGVIKALKFSNIEYSRKEIDKLTEFVKIYGAKGLAYLKKDNDTYSGSLNNALSEEEKNSLGLNNKDIMFIVSGDLKTVNAALGALRVKVANEKNLIDRSKYCFAWITEFPMFEYSETEGRYMAAHHPFTSPREEDLDKLLSDKAHCYSRAYDLVLNGYELLSGSVRIHNEELQAKVFEALELTPEKAKERFGFFLEAFEYGAPPHLGVGIGLERLVMILSDTDNIKDVVAFPKTASAMCLMSDAPSGVDNDQLRELGLKVE